jgi:hypothetical protein
MEALQNFTELDTRHQEYIDFVATGGMAIVDGKLEKISGEQLAKKLKVSRVTVYNWRESVPGFWDYVKERRNTLYARDRMSMVYNAVFKKSLQGDIPAAKLLMQQSKLLEAERVDHTTNGKDLPSPIYGGMSSGTTDSQS